MSLAASHKGGCEPSPTPTQEERRGLGWNAVDFGSAGRYRTLNAGFGHGHRRAARACLGLRRRRETERERERCRIARRRRRRREMAQATRTSSPLFTLSEPPGSSSPLEETSPPSVSPERSSAPASPQNYAISSSAFCQRSRQRALSRGVSCCTTGLCPGPCLPPWHPSVHFLRRETDHLAYKIVTLATSPLKQSSPSRNDQQQVNSPKCSHRLHRRGYG